jgi:hypothetical protein
MLDRDGRHAVLAAVAPVGRRPVLDRAQRVAGHDARIVGVDAVDEDADRGRLQRIDDPAREVATQYGVARNLAAHHRRLGMPSVDEPGRPEVLRAGEAVVEASRFDAGIFVDQAEVDVARVERDAVADQQQQHDRHHQRDGDRGGVADDLHELLAQQAAETQSGKPHPGHDVPAGVAMLCAWIRATNASSSVGSASSGPAKRRFSSSGRPVAINFPA